MKKSHLIWIIPLALLIGSLFGTFIMSSGQSFFYETYPVIRCIYIMEDAMNVDTNIIPFTKESQRRAIEYRCAIEFILDLDKNLDLEDIWEEKEWQT